MGEALERERVGLAPSAAKLLKEREPFYLQAEAEIKCDIKSAEQVAEDLVNMARANAGW